MLWRTSKREIVRAADFVRLKLTQTWEHGYV